MAIQNFKDERTRVLYEDKRLPKGIPADIVRIIQRKLRLLDDAVILSDLGFPLGNRLEALKGDRTGQHSIRVNDQFRLCFVWTQSGPVEVEFVDYHR